MPRSTPMADPPSTMPVRWSSASAAGASGPGSIRSLGSRVPANTATPETAAARIKVASGPTHSLRASAGRAATNPAMPAISWSLELASTRSSSAVTTAGTSALLAT